MTIEGLASSLGLFYFLTIAAFAVITRKKAEDDMDVFKNFMLSMFLKMIVALVYFFIMMKQYKDHELHFALSFFISYLVCTGFEIVYIFSNLRQI